MEQLFLNRRRYRIAGIFFNIGITAAALLVFGPLIYVGAAIVWILAALFLFSLVVITLGLILLDSDFFHAFSSISDGFDKIKYIFYGFYQNASIAICIVACAFLAVAISVLAITPKMYHRNAKLVLSVIGIPLAIVATVLFMVVFGR